MWRLRFLVSACMLSRLTAQDTVTDKQVEAGQLHQDVCHRVGDSFCGSRACVPELEGETFSCDCGEDHFYDVREGKCAHVHSCTASRCHIGICEDGNRTAPGTCDCSNKDNLTPDCEVTEEKKEECKLIGGTISVGPNADVECVCSPSEVLKNDRCLPTTCLNFSNTCEQLCRRNLLREDHRCCQGWKQDNCTAPDVEGGYCEPGYIKVTPHDNCIDACSAGETNPVCPVDCTANTTDGAPYNCVCKEGLELADDGLRCLPKTICNAEERTRCREDQVCELEGHVAMCKCASDRKERSGQCSGNCTLECHHRFGSCTISNNQEHCHCVSPLEGDSTAESTQEGPCILEKYSYLASFKLNRTLSSWKVAGDCHDMKDLLMQAFCVLLGPEFLRLDIISCLDAYKVRLIFSKKQDEAVLKRLHLCKSSLKPHSCYLWPDVHVISGTVGSIEPENICETVLRDQLGKYEGAYVCKAQDHEILFDCVNPAAVTGTETSGRIIKQHCSEANKPPSSGTKKGKKNEPEIPPNQTAVIVGVVLAVLAALGIIAVLVITRKRKAAKAEQRQRQEKYEADLQQ